MRSFVLSSGPALVKSPNLRRRARRRRIGALVAVMAVALAGGLLGYLDSVSGRLGQAVQMGPFSYFPSK